MNCRLIIWDEGPMANKLLYESLNRSLQDLRDNRQLFGGIVMVIGGDFRQTLPIVHKGVKMKHLLHVLLILIYGQILLAYT